MSLGEEIMGAVYERGEVIFREGDPGDAMYVIQSGAVEISRLQNGVDVALAIMEKGDFFGEMSLLDRSPRSATVRTLRRTRLLPLKRDSILERIQSDPTVLFHLLNRLSRRIEEVTSRLRGKVERSEELRFALAGGVTRLTRGEPESSIPSRTLEDNGGFEPAPVNVQGSDQTDPLNHVPIQSAQAFLRGREAIRLNSGDLVFKEGDAGDRLYFIISGKVEVAHRQKGVDVPIAHLGPNDFFGEMAIITGRPRTATVTALQRTTLASIYRDEFFESINSRPELALHVLQMMIYRFRILQDACMDPEGSIDLVRRSFPPPIKKDKKPRVGIVSLSTCGGCAAVLLNDHGELASILEMAEIVYCPMLTDNADFHEVDVAVVDGLVRVKEDDDKLREARAKSRYIVAWGTCSTYGGIPVLANRYELEDLLEESYGRALDPFAYYLSGLRGLKRASYQGNDLTLLRRAGKSDHYVRVDYYLPGCPPHLGTLTGLIHELRGEPPGHGIKKIVCMECGRKAIKGEVAAPSYSCGSGGEDPAECLNSSGRICLGFLTRGGCGSPCTRGGLPCWGCRGPSDSVMKKMAEGKSHEEIALASLAKRLHRNEEEVKPVLREMRRLGNSSFNFEGNFFADTGRLR